MPTDPIILKMDEITKKWHFYCWIEERDEKAKFMKDIGCFIGSFSNPEMAQKIREMDNAKKYECDEEGFDAATKFVKQHKSKKTTRRRRKKNRQ